MYRKWLLASAAVAALTLGGCATMPDGTTSTSTQTVPATTNAVVGVIGVIPAIIADVIDLVSATKQIFSPVAPPPTTTVPAQ